MELIATLVFGLVAGAWVDRLRRRPVLIWADLGRAALLGSIPVAFAFGVLTFVQLLIVSALAAILTTFFDSADNAYLPIDRRARRSWSRPTARWRPAGRPPSSPPSGSAASSSSGSPHRSPSRSTRSATSCRRSCSATIRREEAPPPPREDREPVLSEIRDGLRIVRHDPVLRAFVGAQMSLAALWGIFGATWFLFVLDELRSGAGRAGRHRRGRWLLVVHRRDGRDAGDGALRASVPWRSSRCCSRRSATRSSRWRRPGCRSSPSAAS